MASRLIGGIISDVSDPSGLGYTPEWEHIAAVRPMVGSFRFWFTTDRWEWSPELYRLHGYDPGEIEPTTELLIKHKHPDDHHDIAEAITRSIDQGEPFSSHHRFLDTAGGEHNVMVVADRIFNSEGRPVGTTGFYIDLSDERADAQRDVLNVRMPEMVHARALIEQAKGVLMRIYGINANQAFRVLVWRSQETNTKLRDLAEQILLDLQQLPPPPAATVAAFDHLLLTAHERTHHRDT